MFTYKVQVAEGAVLQATRQGDVLLLINDVLYEPGDIIPAKALPPKPPVTKRDARNFVLSCCIFEYGPNHDHWPDLARSFVDEGGHFQPPEEKTLRSAQSEAE